ncbi:hypothetical protein LOD99_15357 [Oopsacas minuta]|uniref:Uncharacterized protein n=1 Tax=Oopsacas minuta TaxID=111878 RepID=A0AAV7KBL4_9METZ|nr:hypothetical protein LOD99_15357 [Oopsacas minuta]
MENILRKQSLKKIVLYKDTVTRKMEESNGTKCQGLMTVTNKHLVYASLQESAFTPNKRWRLNTIHKIHVSDKNSLSFETEDENISFEMEKPNKVLKLVKKQKKKILEKEKKRAPKFNKESRRASLETILGTVVTQGNAPNKMMRRNTSIERVEKHSFDSNHSPIVSTPSRRNMALPPEPIDNPYFNMRGRNMGRSNTDLEPLHETTQRDSFMRYRSLPPVENKPNKSCDAIQTLPIEENYVYSSGMSSSEDDFTDMKSMEDLINERKYKLEKLKRIPTNRPYRTKSVCDLLNGDYVDLTFEKENRKSLNFEQCIYDNLPNSGLYANGSCPFERIPNLQDDDCHYAELEIKSNESGEIHRNEEYSTYSRIDFIATHALEMAKESLRSVC